jgi:adenylate cyclase, class 2
MATEPNRLEIEAKIPVEMEQLESIRTRLLRLGARRLSPPLEEENFLMDFPDGRLREAGQALRIRRYGQEALLTFKGRILHHESLKRREELETVIAEAGALAEIFRRLGLEISFRYAKIRETYQLEAEAESLSVCLDQTPIGAFVEIEGREEAILRLAREFGWNTFIRKSYVELYREAGLGQP